MANTYIGGSDGTGLLDPEQWVATMQQTFWGESQATQLYNLALSNVLARGTVVHKPYATTSKAATYTPGTAGTIIDVTATDDTIVANTTKVIWEYIDRIEGSQSLYNLYNERATEMGRHMNNLLEQAAAANITSANNTVDDGSIGGTSGNTIVMSTSNIDKIFAAASRALDGLRIPTVGRYAKITPRTLEFLRLYLAQKGSSEGQEVGEYGRVLNRFGFELFLSNNCYFTASLAIGTNPTEADTVKVDGVTFTFNATPSGAGSVDIGTGASGSVTNLTAAINDSGTVGTTYIQLSSTNRRRLIMDGVVATDGTTKVTIVGYGDIVTAETLTAAADVWSVQILNLECGLKGQSINLVTTLAPKVESANALPAKLIGDYVAGHVTYGTGVWNNDKDSLVRIKVDASVFA